MVSNLLKEGIDCLLLEGNIIIRCKTGAYPIMTTEVLFLIGVVLYAFLIHNVYGLFLAFEDNTKSFPRLLAHRQ